MTAHLSSIINTTDSAFGEAFDTRHIIAAKETSRNLTNLHLLPIELIATKEEYEAMYSPGVYQRMMKQFPVQNKE